MAAADAVEPLVRKYHGDPRANALAMHHARIPKLAKQFGWPAARRYDILERENAVSQPTVDLGTYNHLRMQMVSAELSRAELSAAAAQLVRQQTAPSTRRYQPQDSGPRDSGPQKRARTEMSTASGHCFRCGRAGHFPAKCTAHTTCTGKPCAPLSPTSKSAHGLQGPNGAPYCFYFVLNSSCRDGASCINFHGCSICGATSHGAKQCNHV